MIFRFLILVTLVWNVCGNDDDEDSGEFKIVSGYPVIIEQHPYHVTLSWTSGNAYLCGGVLIASNYVLTAAHCVRTNIGWNVGPEDIKITAGVSSIRESGVIFYPKKITMHPDYDIESKHNDIALIELTESVQFNNKTSSIPLVSEKVPVSTLCTTVGFGSTYYGGPVPTEMLLAVLVPVRTKVKCKVMYYKTLRLHDGQMCAGFSTGFKDACVGDSGGPFVCHGKLAGIVSAGIKCGEMNKPGIYTDVNYYKPWIMSILNSTGVEI